MEIQIADFKMTFEDLKLTLPTYKGWEIINEQLIALPCPYYSSFYPPLPSSQQR